MKFVIYSLLCILLVSQVFCAVSERKDDPLIKKIDEKTKSPIVSDEKTHSETSVVPLKDGNLPKKLDENSNLSNGSNKESDRGPIPVTETIAETDAPVPGVHPEPPGGKDTTTSTEPTPTTPKTTTTAPNITTTDKPTTASPSTTHTPTSSTSTKPTSPTPPVTSSTVSPTSTTPHTGPTAAPVPKKGDRSFDGLSFFAGIVMSAGLLAIGVVAYKFYEARRERNYHTL